MNDLINSARIYNYSVDGYANKIYYKLSII